MLMSGEPAADPAEPSPELLAPLEAPRPHFWWDADPEEMAKLFRLAPLGASAIPVTAPDGADPDPGLERPHDNVVAFPGARIPAVIDAASAEVESPEPEIAAISPPPVEIIGQPRAASAILDDARTREDPEHAHNPPLPREAAETEAAIPEGVDP